jgi:ABC-type transporter Mla maintaining outer membrane lipid asymmetry permease subunit MlaE
VVDDTPEGVDAAAAGGVVRGAEARSTGRRVARALVIALAVLVVLVVLFTIVFPWVETLTDDPTLGG